MANKDYYSILGVSRNATDKEISSAFKKLSMKWHPDRWAAKGENERKEAEEKYKEINYAHQILSDPEKRKNYDQFGDPDGKGMKGGGFDMGGFGDFFSAFGNMHGFGGGFDMGGFGQQQIERGKDITMRIPLTIEEIFKGCTKKVKFNRNTRCPNCHGAGGTGQRTCPDCHGTGQKVEIQRTPFGVIKNMSVCPHCHGTGMVTDKKCPSCNGTGFKQSPNSVEVTIPAGAPNGGGILIKGQGSESSNIKGENGNFIAVVQYAFDTEKYTIDNLDVIEKIYVPYYDLLLGCDYTIDLPNGTKKKISLNSCIEEGKYIKLYREGIKRDGAVGDYYIEIHYEIPKSLTKEERKNIENIKVEKTTKKYE